MDLVSHLRRHRDFSMRTFGPPSPQRQLGVIDHLRKEIVEVEKEPYKLEEWIDVIILGIDGAWRAGHSPEEIAAGLLAKQLKNERRKWPNWWDVEPGKAIEHVRGVED